MDDCTPKFKQNFDIKTVSPELKIIENHFENENGKKPKINMAAAGTFVAVPSLIASRGIGSRSGRSFIGRAPQSLLKMSMEPSGNN